MNVLHFIGVEAKGGNVRYAEVMHQRLIRMGVGSELLCAGDAASLARFIRRRDGPLTVVFHASEAVPPRMQLLELRQISGCRMIVFAHNPQLPKNWDLFDMVVPVSEYVRQTLLRSGLEPAKVFGRPAYPAASYFAGIEKATNLLTYSPMQNSEYEWNTSKVRDFFFQQFDRLGFRPWRYGTRTLVRSTDLRHASRIRLGIVSRIARAKRFPELFRLLHHGLANASDIIEIHIVGSGPWRQIQGVKAQIPPSVRPHVFFWGWQSNPWACLPRVDALVVGMPEKEALGLNILEATARRIPVIGINGGPFPELIESSRNGWLLSRDNIEKDFCEVVAKLKSGNSVCSFIMSKDYDHRFSDERFEEILLELLDV